MTKSIHTEVLISAIGSGVFSLTFGVLANQDIQPLFLSTWFIVFLLLMVYQSTQVIGRLKSRGYHNIIQGEDIDYQSCRFTKIQDDADETGETIINELNWRLAFDIPGELRSGTYMANIRIRKASSHAQGIVRFNIETNGIANVAKLIDIGAMSTDVYSYIDHKFQYDGAGSIKVIIEPGNTDAGASYVLAFDRLELYGVRGASPENGSGKKGFLSFLTFTTGYLLSPLSWWNDTFVNIPIAWACALGAKLVNQGLFQPIFVIAYIGTNIAGMVLMDKGKNELHGERFNSRYFLKSVLISVIYVAAILVISKFDFMQTPRWPF